MLQGDDVWRCHGCTVHAAVYCALLTSTAYLFFPPPSHFSFLSFTEVLLFLAFGTTGWWSANAILAELPTFVERCVHVLACVFFWGGEPFTLSTPSRVGVWGVVFRELSFFFPFHTPLFSPFLSIHSLVSFHCFPPTQCMGRSHCLFWGFISVYQPSFYYVTRKQQYSI